jgi:hypothetical protein
MSRPEAVVVTCMGCGAQETLEPVRTETGWVVRLEPLDGWTVPPMRCPACSVPPVPESVRLILCEHLTGRGIRQWWRSYLRLDPHAQEGHAGEHARKYVEKLELGQGCT